MVSYPSLATTPKQYLLSQPSGNTSKLIWPPSTDTNQENLFSWGNNLRGALSKPKPGKSFGRGKSAEVTETLWDPGVKSYRKCFIGYQLLQLWFTDYDLLSKQTGSLGHVPKHSLLSNWTFLKKNLTFDLFTFRKKLHERIPPWCTYSRKVCCKSKLSG